MEFSIIIVLEGLFILLSIQTLIQLANCLVDNFAQVYMADQFNL